MPDLFPDGVLVIDKPEGPTSHDIVAVARRVMHGKKVGHTGTLDPLASGVLPLVLGKATRLAQFLSAAEKTYVAELALGRSTTTFDRAGADVPREGARPVADVTRSDIDAAVDRFRGSYLQPPPPFSAKKIDGDRAYDLARRNEPVALQPSAVTVQALEVIEWEGARLRLRLVCSAGFYVRSLAQAVGEQLGTGAYLNGLVRTASGDFTIESAVSMADLDRRPEVAAARVIGMDQLLPWLPAVAMTAEGASLAAKGGFLSASHLLDARAMPAAGKVRLLHPDGHLVAIAEPRLSGPSRHLPFLHPGVVLE
ncbi:MAG TPA: tRNA pseudouridine(55) synthase TruB [Vicinamibacterales bacterium]|nr:tRNA pseudouridine(55) synthase TruB [Vicinamibacterales bacterium]